MMCLVAEDHRPMPIAGPTLRSGEPVPGVCLSCGSVLNLGTALVVLGAPVAAAGSLPVQHLVVVR